MKEKLLVDMSEIGSNIDEIRNKLPSNVTLLAATKTIPVDVINYAIDNFGLTDIGENRVQELIDKYDMLHKDKVNIHFIGTLQSNKVKYIIDKVSLIHSLDSIKLAYEIDRQAAKAGKCMDVLAEVNIGEESSKGGVYPEQLEDFIDEVIKLPNIQIKGLMTMAPVWDNSRESDKNVYYKKYFSKTYQIFIDILQKKLHNIDVPVLSMGMSDSYEAAIECGSTMVRIGTALFGKRS